MRIQSNVPFPMQYGSNQRTANNKGAFSDSIGNASGETDTENPTPIKHSDIMVKSPYYDPKTKKYRPVTEEETMAEVAAEELRVAQENEHFENVIMGQLGIEGKIHSRCHQIPPDYTIFFVVPDPPNPLQPNTIVIKQPSGEYLVSETPLDDQEVFYGKNSKFAALDRELNMPGHSDEKYKALFTEWLMQLKDSTEVKAYRLD